MVKLSGEMAGRNDIEFDAVVSDLNALALTIPGLSQIEWPTQENFRGRMKLKLPVGMMTSRIEGSVKRGNGSLTIGIKGRVVNVAGGFEATVLLTGESGHFAYELTAQFAGWLASLGDGLLQSIMTSQAREFEGNFIELLTVLNKK